MNEYLTTKELSQRIKMAPGTIRNLIWKQVFVKNIHYVKPTPGKTLYKWNAIESWLHSGSNYKFEPSNKLKINI